MKIEILNQIAFSPGAATTYEVTVTLAAVNDTYWVFNTSGYETPSTEVTIRDATFEKAVEVFDQRCNKLRHILWGDAADSGRTRSDYTETVMVHAVAAISSVQPQDQTISDCRLIKL